MRVGILALQGNYRQHQNVLNNISVDSILVRYPGELKKCNGLIIPGGESSSISKQIDSNNLRKPIINFSKQKPILGICAGLILLSKNDPDTNMKPLNIINIKVQRNGYGRQIHSFISDVSVNLNKNINLKGSFIRAPKIIEIDKNINIIGKMNNQPVVLRDKNHLVCSFHPEVNGDSHIHKYFVDILIGKI